MKISWNWLQDYIEGDKISMEEVSEILTSIGLEVESVEQFESLRGGLKNFFIGEVIACSKHPNADKLSLTEVDLGGEIGIKKIVCGAPNVAKGQKVVVATEGAVIYLASGESFSIKNSKIRGEESQGMICAEDELGLGTNHDGILVLHNDAQIGMAASDYFGVYRDIIFEIGLTPNRTDAMSHKGVARDLVAAMSARGMKAEFLDKRFEANNQELNTTLSQSIKIDISTPKVAKFGGFFVEGFQESSSPEWMKHRLKSIGENSRNIWVDVTNYILHDLGQPLHAYDADKLIGMKLEIVEAEKAEKFQTLTNVLVDIKEGDIVIQDEEKVVGLAGIMGSKSSEVNESTKRIFFEGAYFDAKQIRQTSKRLNLRTEAAVKFEKGIDANATESALKKAMMLLSQEIPELIFSEIQMEQSVEFPNWEVYLSKEKLALYANEQLEESKVTSILSSLGIQVKAVGEKGWTLSVPRFKEDVKREEDVIEEVLRIYGYNLLPYPKYLKSNLSFTNGLSRSAFEIRLSDALTGYGVQEVITNSISQSRFYKELNPIKLLNSMTSELDSMRASMIPGLLEVVEYNLNRDQKDLALFEIGNEYSQVNGKYEQSKKIVIIATGNEKTPNWEQSKGVPVGYFYVKGLLERLIKQFELPISYSETTNSSVKYGMNLILQQKNIGNIGFIGELIWDRKMFDIRQPLFYVEVDFEAIYRLVSKHRPKYKEVSKYPTVARDLAIVIENHVEFSSLDSLARKTLGKTLTDVRIFDIFRGDSIGQGKKSYALRFVLGSEEKTLSDKEIESMMQKLIVKYKQDFGAEIRA